MNSIVSHMGKYDHRQHVLSDWLTELEQRFQLGDVETDKGKITWCQLLIGATGSSILAGLEDGASWDIAKETLLSRLGVGSVRDEAWAALKELKRGSKAIVELAGEAEKLFFFFFYEWEHRTGTMCSLSSLHPLKKGKEV